MSNVRHGAHSARLGVAQVCAAGVLWGTGGLVVSVLHEREGLGAMTVSAWRMLLAAAALLAFAAATRHLGATVALFRAHPVRTTLVGCGTAAYQALYFAAVLTVGVSVATVVSAVSERLVQSSRVLARTRVLLTSNRNNSSEHHEEAGCR